MAGSQSHPERRAAEDGAELMSRAIPLNNLKTGITRLREKGGASPQALYDLVNGYLDQSGSPVSRDGTTLSYTLPAGTKGLCAFEGKLHVFATSPITVTNPLYVVDILVYPVAGVAATITKIHFAKPFLGYLYVVAEFSTGLIQHYWLQKPAAWTANTVYPIGATVSPTTDNGMIYTADTAITAPVWQPNTAYNVGDTVRPSVDNGYIYQVQSVAGASPASGSTEPTWPAQEGALVFEETDTTTVPSTGQTTTTSTSTIPPVVFDRYGNSIQVNSA